MARQAKADTPPPNSANRQALIRQLDKQLAPIEAEIEELKEKRKTLRHQFKIDAGMSLAEFDAGRRLAKIEDPDARSEKVNNLKDVYNSLSEGEQLDWITAAQ